MRLKFLAGIFLVLMMITGCGGEEPTQPQGDVEKVGMLPRANLTEKQIDEYAKIFDSAHGIVAPPQKTVYYDNMTSMQMSLTAGSIDTIRTYGSVAKYMFSKNSELKINEWQTVQLVDYFSCAVREDDLELHDKINVAINSMRADGTLDGLVEKFITNLKPDEEPPAVAMPKIAGVDSIKVGITGDLPPLDLILADGTPAGFNTAVLAEISLRINKNIELLQIDSASRAAALTSGKVDVIFWMIMPDGDNPLPTNSDTPEGVALTAAYYKDVVVDVSLSSAFAGM